MSVERVRVVLGRLQEEPENGSLWEELTGIVTAASEPTAGTATDLERILGQARARYAERREWIYAAKLLELEVELSQGPFVATQLVELGRIHDEELFDSIKATAMYERVLEIEGAPDAAVEKASQFLEAEESKRAKWSELCDRYLAEAATATDDSFKSVLFASAADVAHRYGQDVISKEALTEYIETALKLDPKNRRATLLAEVVYAKAGDFDSVTRVLGRMLTVGASREDRVAAGLKSARILSRVLDRKDEAIDAYQQVLDMAPGQPDALSYLAEAFEETEQWDHLVALYEDQLKGGLKGDAELGMLLQIAMVHWRRRDKPEAAEPYFERIRRADPTHAGMLAFFRDVCAKKGDTNRLVSILTDAQRATQDANAKKELATEIAKLAEQGDNAGKAIEQYRQLAKADPNNVEAREALKRLYTQTANFAALAELLRQDLDRLAADDAPGRAAVLREIANLYRDKQKNEQALVATLVQLTNVDPNDIAALRELIEIYEHLGRFRDLLICQQKLAEISTDPAEKAELYRSSARRWADQFSNVQNAITAYEGLLAVAPSDEEARAKLRELYGKRRAWPQLFTLMELEAKDAEGPAKVELLNEMAKLAAERLDRGADAISIQKQILELDPANANVFDALEKQAEREKDYATLAEVLEKRVDATPDEQARLALLQKLGAVYETRIKDPNLTARTWKRVLELSPGHQKALRVLRESYLAAGDFDALEALYEGQGDYENLADFLSTAADKAAPNQKVAISFRAARIYEEKLNAKERASRSYERILTVEPTNAKAAAALVPTYEKDERWARLPALYEVLLSVAETDEESSADDKRVRILRKLAAVAGGPLADKAGALGFARRAYEILPDAEQLELLESWSRAASSWGPFVEAVEARLKKKDDLTPELERALKLKLADAYARELGKIDEAVQTYREIVTADPHDADVIQAFDALLRGAERQADLRWLYGVRVEAADPERRAEIYEEWATLEEDVFGNAKDAIELYKKATELEPNRGDALRALSRLLLAAGDYRQAATVIARHRDSSEGEARAQREIELAELYIGQLDEPALAFEACVRALELRPRDPDAVTILSRLLDYPQKDASAADLPNGLKSADTVRAKAARVLEDEYHELGDARRESQVLAIVMESEGSLERRLALHQKLADVEDKLLSAPGTAFATVLRALNEFPDEMALWDRAASLGMRAGRPTDLAESYRAHIVTVDPEAERRISRETELLLCERAAALHDDQLGDADGAMPYLKRILQMEPSNDKAFERLKQILTGSERWSELEELFEQAASNSTDVDRKIGLLGEVAMVAEEIMGDASKAIRYHERILSIDPLHVPSLDTLEKLYEDEERFMDLGKLLERRLETSVDDEAVDIRLYLGRLYLERLEQPEASLTKCEEILHARPDDPEARELAERLLELEPLRLRTAVLLEGVYEARDDAKSLVRMLEIRLERSRDLAEKRDLLRRISEIRDERLQDPPGAFAAYAERLPMDPEDEPTRARFIELGKSLGLYSKVADVLSSTADATTAKPVRAAILMSVAELYDRFGAEGPLDDVAKAEEVYAKVIDTDPNDPAIVIPAARALAQIHTSKGNHAALAETLSIEVKLEESIDKRKELYEKLGVLYETELNDPAKAVEAYRARLGDDPGDLEALSALERLYASKGDYRELVRVLRAREEATTDEDERRRAMIKVAETLSSLVGRDAPEGGPVGDIAEAINAWRAVLDTFGPERSTLAALAKLYEQAERYADLAETLEVDLSLADEPKDRIDLVGRLGDVRRKHLHDLPGALDAYRQALELDTSDPRSRAALESMLASEEGKETPIETQKLAAEILHPLYEAEGENEKLLRVLEVEAAAADGPSEKLEKIAKALSTAEGPLGDKDRAYAYATRAVREAAGEDSITEHVETLERLTEATGKYADTLALYQSVVGDLMNGDAQQTMLLRIGELATEKANDRKLAIEYYKRALEARSDDRRALIALEKLYEARDLDPETGPTSRDPSALLEILRRRTEVAENEEERRELLFRQADLQETSLDDGEGAVTTLEAVLDIPHPDGGLDPRATSKLETLYTVQKRFKDLVGLYERRLDVLVGDGQEAKADLRVKIAKIQRAHLDDTSGAFDELRAALDADPDNAGALAELESILDAPLGSEPGETTAENRARAAEMIEPTYLKRAEWKNVRRALDARIAAAEGSERIDLLRRLATLFEEQLEDYNAALETMAKVLHEDLLDEGVWSELERLARVASATKRLGDIYSAELSAISDDDEKTARLARRTGEIYAELGDADAALKWFRRVHAFEPESKEMFDAIDALLVKEKRHEERVALYRAAYDYREGEEKLALLHTVAELEENQLERLEDAVETHRAALDVDPEDTTALDRLTALYKKLERHRDLADLYLRRAEAASSPEAAAPYRLALASLNHGTLGDTGAAIDQLEAIVTDVPWHKEAIAELEALSSNAEHKSRVIEILRPLYERADDWQLLVKNNNDRLTLTEDRRDRATILKENSKLFESRGQEIDRAFDAMRSAFEEDPADADTRGELERLAKAVDAFERLAESYEKAVDRVSEDFEKRELLSALARVYDEELDDPRRALVTSERLYQLDPTEAAPLGSMDDLAVLLGDWPKVIDVLERRAENAADADAADIQRRIARTRHEMLDDWSGAAAAYERALTLDADHADTVDRLTRLYEDDAFADVKPAEETSQRLVELYGRRVELAGSGDADLRYDLNVRAGKRLEEVLKNPREAIVSFNAALEAKPGDVPTLLSLERLLRGEKAWHELLENLQTQAGLADNADGRAEKRIAIGNLYLAELESPEDALEQFRLVLDEKPELDEPQKRVIEIAKAREDLRRDAAEVVLPVLRAQGKHAERVEVLELKLTAQEEPAERAATLREIAGILEDARQMDDEALDALLRALADVPDDASLHTEIERLAAKIGNKDGGDAKAPYLRYADALDARGKDQADAGIARGLYVRLGKIAEERLEDPTRAVGAYKRAVEHAGDEADLLEALDRLYGKTEDYKELADILERRVAISTETEQAELLYRLAKIQLDKHKETTAGLGSLRAALEKDPTHTGAREAMEALTDNPALFEEAAETLENVYRQSGDNVSLAKLYEKRIKYAPTSSERIRMRLDLSKVLEDRANDADGALKVLLGALGDDPTDSDVLAEIERLATITSSFKPAAEALEAAIKAHDDVRGEPASDLWIRAAGWRKDKVQDLEGAEKDYTEALAHDEQNVVILRSLEEIQRAPGRERDLVATLRRIAKLEGSSTAADLRREAKGLAERVDDDALAEAILREMVAADDADVWALTELTKKREKAEDFKETYSLLVRRAELAAEGDVIRELRHEAASVAKDKLNDTKSAIELYETIFEDAPTDERAPAALRGLYESTGKKKELLKLLERLIDVADGVSRRSALRIEAAQVSEELDAPSEAIDHLRAALDDEPTHKDATLALSRLLEKTGRDEELAELLNTQIELAEKRSDKDAELSYRVRLGEVYESRLGNVEKAIETFKTVLERDEKNFGALMALARLEENKGSKDEAAKVLERALDVAAGGDAGAAKDQAITISKRLTQMFEGLKDVEGQRRALEKGLSAQKDEAELRDKLRKVYEAQKAYPELAKLITEDARAATEVPEKVRRLRAAADIHSQKLSDPATAATLLAEASELVPNDRELLLVLCDAYSASGRAKEALGVLQKIIDSFGGRRAKELAPIHHRLAKAYLADGDKQKALTELDSAFRLDPGSVGVLRDLGTLSLELADAEPAQKDAYLDRAAKAFKALLMQRLDDSSAITKGEIFFYLAETHHRQGDDKKAIQMLERALDTDKNLEKAKTMLAKLKNG